mgnify:CR=1 FL=1
MYKSVQRRTRRKNGEIRSVAVYRYRNLLLKVMASDALIG